MIPSPTTTSQAAITITIRAKTCPSWLPSEREKASRARFPAFSISSRQSRITSGLRRMRTPATPTANSSAERTRYQCTSITGPPPQPRLRGCPGLVRDDDPPAPPPHGGDEQQHGRCLEGDQEPFEQQLADRRGRAEAELDGRPLRVDRLQAGAGDRDRQLDE